MKHKVRDEDVELFGGCKAEHVAPLEINPVQEAKNPSVLFRPLGAGPFEAGVLERVNPSYLRVLVEISTDTTQESACCSKPFIRNLTKRIFIGMSPSNTGEIPVFNKSLQLVLFSSIEREVERKPLLFCVKGGNH